MTTMTERLDRYPSRNAPEPTITPRLDPVLHGRPEGVVEPRPGGPLDVDQLRTYADTGVLVMPGLLGQDRVDELNAQIDSLAADPATRARTEAILEPESEALRSLFEVHDLDGPVGALAGDPILADVARDLLDSDVYVHQSRINLKPGFRGKEFYWHSDFETWHTEDGMPSMRAVSCSVLLTPNHSWNGPLLTIAGSHKWFVSCVGETPANHHEVSLRRQEIGVPDDESLAELARRGELRECTGPPGTVVFFECNVMHGSNGNITPAPRRNVFLVYNSVENALEEPFAAPAPRPSHIAAREVRPL
ncbi:MAG TPA: ectoine hydroxylase [Acidimicrobiales bacterium]